MRIATWNVNSVRQRIENLMSWLKECSPDIVCLQEIKCTDDAFPRLEIESLGYNVVTHGQKTFNGVALLSKYPFEETASGLAGDDEVSEQRPRLLRRRQRCSPAADGDRNVPKDVHLHGTPVRHRLLRVTFYCGSNGGSNGARAV